MQKYIQILEQNVEWIALGLGGVYLLVMVWFFVIGNPVTTQVNNQALKPGDVNAYIAQTQVETLRRNIEDTAELNLQVEPFAQRFAEAIRGEGIAVASLPLPWINSPTTMIEIAVHEEGPGFQVDEADRVAELPQPPRAIYEAARKGRSTVSLPEDQTQMDPLRPQRFLQRAMQPSQADKDWVTVSFTIPMDDLAREFRAKNIPEMASDTMFLRLELIREERLPDGTWGNQTVVSPMAVQQMPTFPPGEGRIALLQYQNWAAANQLEIVRPEFYEVIIGDEWLPPGFDPEMQIDTIFNPAEHVGGRGDLTDEQWQQVLQYRRWQAAQQRQEQQQQRQTQPRTRGEGAQPRQQRPPRGQRGMDDFYALRDPDRPQVFAQVRPGQRQRRMPGMYDDPYMDDMYMDDMYYDPGMGPGMGMRQRMDYPGLPPHQAQVLGSPTGRFHPDELGDLEVWAHDETVEAGKTYRYALRYSILNPLYGLRNVAADSALESVFALTSEMSEWSEEVRVDEQVRFFVSRNPVPGSDRVIFQIFYWVEGEWKEASITVTPGDMIRRVEGDSAVTTDWTMVDIRDDMSVLLVNSNGQTEMRHTRSDLSELNKFRERLPAPEPGMDGMMPGMPGAVPGPGGMPPPPRGGPRVGPGMGPGGY